MSNDFKPLELEGFLPYRLNVLAETVSQSLAGIYRRRYAISVPEWRIMATPRPVRHDDRQGHRRAQPHAQDQGLARRRQPRTSRPSPADREHPRHAPKSFLQLTEKGMDAYRKLVPEAHRFIEALIAPIDPAEKQVFNRVLKQLVQRATELSAELDGPDAPAEG